MSALRGIVTGRLLLRPFQAADLASFARYRATEAVARYQSWSPSYSMADAEAFFAEQQGVTFGQRGAWVQVAAVDRATGELAGDCAVRIADDQRDTAEVGVTFAPEHQGKGLAREALGAVVTRLFDEHGIHRVYAETDDRNTAVHHVLERLGFRCEARLVDADWFKDEWTTLRIYAALRRDWPGPRVSAQPKLAS